MISIGRHITTPGDPLQKVQVEKVYHAILSPKSETEALIRQLRIVRTLNPKQYAQIKKTLPYLVCGMFNPAIRKIENFAYTEYFILDIDHLSDKQIAIDQLRSRMAKDTRVMLCFASPSEDGLKVLFKLSERCYDAGVFSLFYKLFARDFSRQYEIEQVIDMKTSDVSRACFVSMDPKAYYNASAETIDVKSYVDTESSYDFFDLQHALQEDARAQQSQRPTQTLATGEVQAGSLPTKNDVGDDVMTNIRAILNPNAKPSYQKPPAFVPNELEKVMTDLTEFITQTGVVITEVISIHYGKKIRTQAGVLMGETNVFYGRKGFSVVMSPRTGTNPEFNQAVADLVKSFFHIS